MKYDVVTYGAPVLREKANPIEEINEDIRQLAADMLQTMYASNGIGLAGQQIGKALAICVVDVPQEHDESARGNTQVDPEIHMPLVMINPVITQRVGESTGEEGCLSVPDIVVPVKRAAEVTVEFLDVAGFKQSIHAGGLLARAVQHELDHLNGVLVVDRVSAVKRVALRGKLKRLKKKPRES